MFNLLKNLVAFDTQNCKQNETPMTQYIHKLLKPYAKKILFLGEKRKNVIAFFGDLKCKNILLLNGHIDTANCLQDAWETPPFELTKKKEKAFGLGSADMKGGLAISISAIIDCVKNDYLKNKCVIFAATVDEENGSCSELGAKLIAKFLAENNIKPKGAIINEPQPEGTPNLRINVGHRGLLWLKVSTFGTTSHSGLLQKEDNAINKMTTFLETIQQTYTNQPQKTNKIPQTSARVLYVNGGSKDIFNKVPNFCECCLDVRISPKDNIDKIFSTISKIAKQVEAKVEVVKKTPSSCISENNKFVLKLFNTISNFGYPVELTYSSPTCDAHYFNAIKIPTINGLGVEGNNIHSANEYINISSLEKMKKIFIEIIKKF